jgi:hypothetical protein
MTLQLGPTAPRRPEVVERDWLPGRCRSALWLLTPIPRRSCVTCTSSRRRGGVARRTCRRHLWRLLSACGEGHERGDVEDMREIVGL